MNMLAKKFRLPTSHWLSKHFTPAGMVSKPCPNDDGQLNDHIRRHDDAAESFVDVGGLRGVVRQSRRSIGCMNRIVWETVPCVRALPHTCEQAWHHEGTCECALA